MADSVSAELQPIVSRSGYDVAVSFALRQFVGRGKRYSSSAALQGPSGVPARRIEAARCDVSDPEHRHLAAEMLLSLAGILGPEFLTLITTQIGQGAHYLSDGADDRDTVPELGEAVALAARHRRDGELDRDERAIEAKMLGPKLVAIGGSMMAAGAAA